MLYGYGAIGGMFVSLAGMINVLAVPESLQRAEIRDVQYIITCH